MSEYLPHECGIVLLRLLQPLSYYMEKYNCCYHGLDMLYLLMEKQHNRGQDGAGVVSVKLDVEPGYRYLDRIRSNVDSPIIDIFQKIYDPLRILEANNSPLLYDPEYLKRNIPFISELYLGHLRYGTYGKYQIEYVHPHLRQSNWRTRTLALVGNFNLTNADQLFLDLINYGQHPIETSDTVTILEKLGYYLDEMNNELYEKFKTQGYTKAEISPKIAETLDIVSIVKKAAQNFDGGYVIAGVLGHGDAFVFRDPRGIRPAYYYKDDEFFVVTSERPPIQTAFNVKTDDIKEMPPGHVLILKKNKDLSIVPYTDNIPSKMACSFEHIYFSRGTDRDIYKERKMLGAMLADPILSAIDYDLENTVFTYIPNTSTVAFLGLYAELEKWLDVQKKEKIIDIINMGENINDKELRAILNWHPRADTLVVKDLKHRTFITKESKRNGLASHVYDVTYGVVSPNIDRIVAIDDSIVRGTTIKKSIIPMLNRLEPKEIVIASTAPQIRYPDCYGIDMARLEEFIAFQAAISLLKERGQAKLIKYVYDKCKEQDSLPDNKLENYVSLIYQPFEEEEITHKIEELLTPIANKTKLTIIYQSLEGLSKVLQDNKGDWYFTGNFPTIGGYRVVNNAFINYYEGKNKRAY